MPRTIDFRSLRVGQGSGAATPAPAPPTDRGGARDAGHYRDAAAWRAVGAAGFPDDAVRFAFDGDFFHLSDFVGRLERFLVVRNRSLAVSGRFMTVDGIALQAAPQGFPRIKASIAATTYLLPASRDSPTERPPAGPLTPRAARPPPAAPPRPGPATITATTP